MKNKKLYIILLIAIILLQVFLRLYIGNKKEYFHIDEAYSYSLMNYDKIQITDNADFLNNWHNKEYFIDYLAINSEEVGDLKPVYENQKNDVHPPLYYLLLRIASTFTIDTFTKWTGIGINIIFFVGISILLFFISKKIFKNPIYALIVVAINGFSIISLETTMYIRMYEMSALFILLNLYVSLYMYAKDKLKIHHFIIYAISLLLGGLTHYYFFIFALVTGIILVHKYFSQKNYKALISLIVTAIICATIFLLIFPMAINHIFFSYRGTGTSLSSIKSVTDIFVNIAIFTGITMQKMFGFLIILLALVIVLICRKRKRVFSSKFRKEMMFVFPTIIYFIIVAILSPYKELRYIMPICPVLVLITIYYLKKYIKNFYDNKSTIFITILFFLSLTVINYQSFASNLEFTYTRYNNIAKRVEEKKAPILYFFNNDNMRFLDDIYLFTLADESYLAKYQETDEEELSQIISQRNMDNGIILIVTEGLEDTSIIEKVKKVASKQEVEFMQQMNACKVYYIY